MQLRFGLWEQETYKYIRRAAAEANWVIEIGAADGELSILSPIDVSFLDGATPNVVKH